MPEACLCFVQASTVLKQQRTCLVGKAIHTLPLLEARAKYCGDTNQRLEARVEARGTHEGWCHNG